LKGFSIFEKLLGAFLATGLAAVLATSWAYYHLGKITIHKDMTSSLSDALDTAVEHFNASYGAPIESAINFVSSSPTLDAYLLSEKNEIMLTKSAAELFFCQVLKMRPKFYRSLRFLDTQGTEVIVVEDGKRLRDYHSMAQADPDPLHQRTFALFERLKSSPAETLVEGPFLLEPGHSWTMLLGRTRNDPESNTFGGAVIMQADLTDFLDYLSRIQAHGYRAAEARDPLGRVLLAPEAGALRRHQTNEFSFTKDITLGSERTILMKLVFHDALAHVFRPIFATALFIVGLLMLVMTILAFGVSRQFSKPFIELSGAAERLAKGARSFQIPVTGGGEIRLVAESFNQMISDLDRTTVSKRTMDNILESLLDALVVLDSAGLIRTVNKAAGELSGYSEFELLGQPFAMLFADAQNLTLVHNAEKELVVKGGRRVPVLLSSSALHNDENQAQGSVCLIRDITERKAAEERLAHSNRELLDFAFIASHDLQEPLRKVQVFGDRLAISCADGIGEEGRDYLGRMQKAVGRMQSFIKDLLGYSSVMSKAKPFERVDLGKIAEEVVSDLEIRIEQSGAKIDIESLPVIDADPLQMRQLFQNLISNALKFRRPGIAPHVRIEAPDPPGGLPPTGLGCICRICVRDNGIGFEQKHAERIFKIFERLNGRDEFEGTGIGLVVCRRIAERHGGRIAAEGVLNQGATFIVELPMKHTERP